MKPGRAAILAVVGVAAAALSIHASTPRFFNTTTQGEFLRGDIENLSIDSRGRVMLGPATDVVYETPAPFVWSLAAASDGTLYLGTGTDGRVYRVDAQGNGSLFFDTAELQVHALALAPDGSVYVGSSPDGRIYKVDRSGASSTFYEPNQRYIWSLAVDGSGVVYAATGENGDVFRITPDGQGTRIYQARATHATALAFDRDGNLLVGTESPGRVLRVDREGRGFLLLDSGFREIKTLHVSEDGTVYATAVNPGASSPSGGGTPSTSSTSETTSTASVSVSVSTEVTGVVTTGDASGASSSGTPSDGRARGAVFRIAQNGLWDKLWESRDDAPYDLDFDRDGRLVVATGPRGKIFRLEGDPIQPTLVTRAAAQQATSLHRDKEGRLYLTTANPGKLLRLSATRATRGVIESDPKDANTVATWGTVSWRGAMPSGSRIEISTRSGNTETPDDTWSPWSSAYTTPDGSPIVSPYARYLQWRAVFTGNGEGPTLTSVSAAYLQRNLRPVVRTLTVHPPGIVFQKPYPTGDPDLAGFDDQTTPERRLAVEAGATPGSSSPSLGRRTYQKGLQTLAWRADDENGDNLIYEVQYRLEADTTWKVLRSDLTESILVWDTTTLPNGTYFVKIVASDERSNAPQSALRGEAVSTAFDIDNTAPAIRVSGVTANGDATIVTFEVVDGHTRIQTAEYSENGLDWRSVFPQDGIADARTERYELRLTSRLSPRGLTLRATDGLNNVATMQVEAPAAR